MTNSGFSLNGEITTDDMLELLHVVDNKTRIGISDYFYVPERHMGIVTLDGVLQRFVFSGLSRMHHPREVIRIEKTSYNVEEAYVDITYRDGSMFRLYETIRYRFNMEAIHMKCPSVRCAIHLVYPKFYPMFREAFGRHLPNDSYAAINQSITARLRQELIQKGIWISAIYTPYRRRIKSLKYTGEDTW